jgi:hypothetical protein
LSQGGGDQRQLIAGLWEQILHPEAEEIEISSTDHWEIV